MSDGMDTFKAGKMPSVFRPNEMNHLSTSTHLFESGFVIDEAGFFIVDENGDKIIGTSNQKVAEYKLKKEPSFFQVGDDG